MDGDQLKFIDFGSSVEYLDEYGIHVANEKQTKFKGIIRLGSANVMNFGKPRRKDDL